MMNERALTALRDHSAALRLALSLLLFSGATAWLLASAGLVPKLVWPAPAIWAGLEWWFYLKNRPAGRGLAAVVSVLGLVLSLYGYLATISPIPSTQEGGSPSPAGQPTHSTPEDAVGGYLSALAKGDAASALAYAAAAPPDTTLLTSDVLTQLNQLTPISNIHVGKASSGLEAAQPGTKVSVDATYDLGGEHVRARLVVQRVGSEWKLQDVASVIDISAARALDSTGRIVQLEGLLGRAKIEIPSSSPNRNFYYPASGKAFVFPGRYRLTSDSDPRLMLSQEVTANSPGLSLTPSGLSAVLSDAGRDEVQKAALRHLNGCLQSHSAIPKVLMEHDCGVGISAHMDGTSDVSVSWALERGSANITNMKLKLLSPSKARVIGLITVRVRATACATSGAKNCLSASADLHSMIADFSNGSVAVRFSSETPPHYDNAQGSYKP